MFIQSFKKKMKNVIFIDIYIERQTYYVHFLKKAKKENALCVFTRCYLFVLFISIIIHI